MSANVQHVSYGYGKLGTVCADSIILCLILVFLLQVVMKDITGSTLIDVVYHLHRCVCIIGSIWKLDFCEMH